MNLQNVFNSQELLGRHVAAKGGLKLILLFYLNNFKLSQQLFAGCNKTTTVKIF
jgi:hypothetical protein